MVDQLCFCFEINKAAEPLIDTFTDCFREQMTAYPSVFLADILFVMWIVERCCFNDINIHRIISGIRF